MTRSLPLAPVRQRASDDVELEVYDDDLGGGWTRHYYRPLEVVYLIARYDRPVNESGLRWQVRRTEEDVG